MISMSINPNQTEFNDFICFLDERNERITLYVKILAIDSMLRFLTKDGNTIGIPLHRVLKIKQKGVKSDQNYS